MPRDVHCLRVDLGSPVASSDPYIHLDSFVSFAAGVESIGHDGLAEMDDGGEPEYFEDEMPFRTYEVDGDWVWATTVAGIATPDGSDIEEHDRWSATEWRKRFKIDPVHQIKDTQISMSSGAFKSYNAALPYTGADELTFFFEPADGTDPERVVEMIETHVSGIGKKRSQGFGQIRDVQVTSAEGAVKSAIYHNGRILRSIPATFAPAVVSGITYQRRTVRPPYWHQANQVMAYPPFVDVPRENFADELGLGEVATA
jgi:CRISPR type IV-associated protein Csf3